MHQPDYSISTPENVDLHLEIAGLGNRLLAQLIDGCIIMCVSIVVILFGVGAAALTANAHLDSKTTGIVYGVIAMVAILLIFILQNAYFLVLEGIMHGQTPGKKLAEIRVIEQNGQPIGWPAAIIRNLMRLIDSLMFLGILIILIDKNERRLGDMAAGTIVIRERKTEISTSHIKMITAATPDQTIDVGKITPAEYDILVDFLRRRDVLAKSYRPVVALRIAQHLKSKLDNLAMPEVSPEGDAAVAVAALPDVENPEEYLERLYLTYQQRALD